MRAYVDPILKLFKANTKIEILENIVNNIERIDISIITNKNIAKKIVLTDLSNK